MKLQPEFNLIGYHDFFIIFNDNVLFQALPSVLMMIVPHLFLIIRKGFYL